ncbi:MAG TPA: glycosyltransferase family 4 protein [Terriglobales bacterium]|nr:glycosyltransferase family 4 protein [Terriglobales bacterium]
MKIIYVSQYFPPEMGAPAARVSELARRWCEQGHAVTVLTGFPNHPTGVVVPEYRKQLRRLILREMFSGIDVLRTWLLPLPNRKAYERVLNYLSFSLSAAISGLFLETPDVVIATSPQLLVGLSGYWLARSRRVPFVFEVRDLWPESLAAVGAGGEKSLLHRLLARLAAFLYRRADHIVVVTPAFKEQLVQCWRVPAEKISVVENGVETDLFHPDVLALGVREELGAEGKVLVSYIGTIGMAHGLETLLQAAVILQSEREDVLLLVLGEGAEKQGIQRRAQELGLRNVIFSNEQPRETIPAYICASDICLVVLKKTDVFRTVIPTKLLEYMACGRSVILGVDGQARAILDEAQAGFFVEPENARQLTDAVVVLACNPELRKQFGQNGRRFVVEKMSRRETAARYLEALNRVLTPATREVKNEIEQVPQEAITAGQQS